MANLLLVNHRNPQLVDGDTLRCYKLRQLMDGGCPKVKVECCEVGLENDPRRNPSLREWRFLTVGGRLASGDSQREGAEVLDTAGADNLPAVPQLHHRRGVGKCRRELRQHRETQDADPGQPRAQIGNSMRQRGIYQTILCGQSIAFRVCLTQYLCWLHIAKYHLIKNAKLHNKEDLLICFPRNHVLSQFVNH